MFNVGEIEVLRVEESLGPGFPPKVLLPDWTPEAVAPHLRGWRPPTTIRTRTSSSPASTAGCSRPAPHHPGRHLRRQPQGAPGPPRFHMLDRPYMENFAKAGLKVEDIDYVLCTHLHVDHVGWNTRLDNGRWVPTFPKAKYVFSKTDRDYFDPTRGPAARSRRTRGSSTTACCRSWRPGRT